MRTLMRMSLTELGEAGRNGGRSVGFLGDKRVPMTLKGKCCRTVVRPALFYGAECWAVKKRQEQKMQVVERRMLQ